MEEGKGLVAVVQGLRDSGVSVMIISRKHLMNSLKSIRQSTTRSSTGTSMEHYVDQKTSTQINTGIYSTSYQLAHCHFNSTPRKELQEFHTQRDEPSQRRIYSAGIISPSQQTPFAQSLRRYPVSPDRSESTELVQRLLNYTQTKYLSRNSSTSMRSLHPSHPRQSKEFYGSGVISKPRVTKDYSNPKKPMDRNKSVETKDTETNCRIRSMATRNSKETKTSKGTVDKTDSQAKKNKKIQSHTRNMPRNDRTFAGGYNYMSNLPRESYNYLKAPSGGKQGFGRRAELRYLNEIKQFLQDYLRQLRSEETRSICPNMLNRYNQHRRKNHEDAMSPVENAQADQQQMSTSKDLPRSGSARCRPPPNTQSAQFIKRIPCPCKSEPRRDSTVIKLTDTILDFLKKISIYTDEAPEILNKRDEMLQQLAAKIISLKGEKASNERVKEVILKCLDNLPMWFPGTAYDWNRLKRQIADEIVGESYDIITSLKEVDDSNEIEDVIHKCLNELHGYADNTPESNDQQEEIVRRLANNINNLKGHADFDDIAKKEINICIDSLPMSFPAAKRDQISDNLLNSIKYVMKRDYNESINAIDKEVQEQTLERLKELPVYADETPQNKAKSKEIVKELAAKLKDRANFENGARYEIGKCKEKLPFRFPGNKIEQDKLKNEIADNLLYDLNDVIGESYKDVDASDIEVEEQTLEWLKDLPVYANETPQNKATSLEMVKNLATKLKTLKRQNNFKNKARDEIHKCIEDFPFWFPGTKQEQEKFKNEISNNLLRDLLSDVKSKSSIGGYDSDKEVEGQTIEWLKEIPVYADETPENKIQSEKMVKELAAKLNSFKGCDSFENRAKYEIDKCMESLPLKFPGTKREQKILKNQVADNLLDDVSDIIGKSNVDEDATAKDVEEQILEWLNELAIYADATPQNKAESKKMVKELAATLKNLQSLDNFEYRAKDEIGKCIDSLPLKFPGTKREQDKLKNEIADSLFNNLSELMGKCRVNKNQISEEQIFELIKRVCDYEDLTPKNREKIKGMTTELCAKLNSNKGHDDHDNKTQEMIKKYIANVVTMISYDIARNISDNDTDDPRTITDDVSKSTSKRRATKNRKNSTVEDQTLDWFNELPAYSGTNSQIKAESEKIVKQLADELDSLKGYDDFDKRAKAKIDIKSLIKGPLNPSSTNKNQDDMKKQLADNLSDNNLNAEELENLKDIFGKSRGQRSKRRVDDNNNKVKQVLDLLKKLPVYAENTPKNKIKTENMVKQLADKLENIKEHDDFEEKAKYEIQKCIESLPFSLPGTKMNQDILKDQITDYFLDNFYVDELSSSRNSTPKSSKSSNLHRVATDPVDASKNVVKDQIYEWLKILPVYLDDTPENKADKEKKIKQLVSQLDSIKSQPDYDEKARDEIFKYINSLPMSFPGDKQDQKNSVNRMTDNLISELNSVEINSLKMVVEKYFDDINFEDAYGKAIDKDKILNDFVIHFKSIMNKSPDELRKDVINMINKFPIKVSGDKNKTISKITNDLVNEVKHLRKEDGKSTMNFADKINEEHNCDWLEDATNVPKQIKRKNKDQIQNVADKVKKMQSEGYDDDVIEDENKDFFNSLPDNGILVNLKDKSNLVKNPLRDIKSKPNQRKVWVQKENIPQSTIDEISELVDDLLINVSPSNREEIKKRIGEVLPENVNGSDSEIVKREIEDILKKESQLPGFQAKGLASTLISKLRQNMPYSELEENVKEGAIRIDKNNGTTKYDDDSEMNEEHIWDWLEDTINVPKQIKMKNKEHVRNFADLVKQMQSEGYDDDVIEDEIKDFLNSLAENGIQVYPKEKGQLLKNLLSEIKSKPNQRKLWVQKENIPQSTIDGISELVDDLHINVRPSKREEIKKRIGEVLAQNFDGFDREKVKGELDDILKREGKMPVTEANNLTRALINRVKGMPLPHRYTNSELEDMVKEGVMTILGDFNIPIKDVEKLEDSLAEVLADQIVRGTDDNSADEQIISILRNANLSDDDIRNITNRLMKRNRELSISDRSPDSFSRQYTSLPTSKALHHNKKPAFTTSTPRKDKFYTSPKRFSIIKPLQPQTLSDDEFTESKIDNAEYQTQGSNMNIEVEDLISKRAQAIQPKLVPTTDHSQLKSPADTRSILSQDTNQFIAENLKGVILEWLKQQPLYIRRTSYEKLVQEHLVNDLVDGLISIFAKTSMTDADTDKFLIEEITKHLKRFPMDAQNKSDKRYIPSLAKELLDYVKNSQIFEDISMRRDLEDKCRVKKNGNQPHLEDNEDNSKTLPLHDLSAEEQLSLNVLKDEVSDAFTNLHDVGNNEEEKNKHRKKINDTIDKHCNDYLKKHPGAPIDRNKLKQVLYTALKNTSQPINRSELEMQQEREQYYKIPQRMQQKTDQNYIIPPSKILSAEDRAHLERIRERSRQNLCPGPGKCGGLSVCPSLGSKPDLAHRSSGVQTSSHRTQAVGSQVDVSPHVVVKEYYWDSVNAYSEPPRLPPTDPRFALFTPPCKSMPEQNFTQSYPYSFSPCYSPCGSIPGQTVLQPQRDVLISQRPSQFSPLSCQCSSQMQRSQSYSRYQPSPSQFTTAGSPSSGYRIDQNLPKFQRYMSQRESQPTTPIPPKSCTNSCSPQPSQGGYCVTSQKEPCSSHHRIPCSPKPRRPWYMKPNVPFSPENNEADPDCSVQRSRLTHLGSFDHVEPKVCNSRSNAWGKRLRNDKRFRNESSRLCLPLDEDSEEAYVNERHNHMERVRRRCKESTLPKCIERKIDQYNDNLMISCSKCCGGVRCPYPSHMFFRK